MDPDQTAPPKEQSDLGPHCLPQRLFKGPADDKQQTRDDKQQTCSEDLMFYFYINFDRLCSVSRCAFRWFWSLFWSWSDSMKTQCELQAVSYLFSYSHATTKLAFHSNDTSKDKLSMI